MDSILPLFVIFVVAWFVPMVLSWLEISKIPSVIVEIVMGVMIGPFVLNLVTGTEATLDFLSSVGFLFLIFLSGLSLDIRKIIASFPTGKWKAVDFVSNTFIVALLIYAGSVALSALIVCTFPIFPGMDQVFLILLFPSVALSIIVPILKNDGIIRRKFGQIILIQGAIATIMTILWISIYAGVYKHNGFKFELLLFLIIFIVFFVAYRVGRLLVKFPLFQTLLYKLEHAASQIRIRGSIAILLLFVLIAQWINTEPVLGAFFAGTLLSIFLPKERSALLFKLDGMGYGFFIPIFFIMVGVNLDMGSLINFQSSFGFILKITVLFYITQVVPALVLVKLFGWKKALSGGLLMTSRLGLSIAVAQIALQLEMITPAANAGVVVASILTCLLSPMLYKILSVEAEYQYGIYIIGGGNLGINLAKNLDLHRISYLVLESDAKHILTMKNLGIAFKEMPLLDLEGYKALRIRSVDSVVISTNSEELNMEIAELLRTKLDHSKIISLTRTPELYTSKSHLDDIDLIDVDQILANSIENRIMRPSTSNALTDNFGGFKVEEFTIRNKNIDRVFLKDLPLPHAASLILVRRENEIFVPHEDNHMLKGDIITAIGDAEALEQLRKLFH